MCSLVSVFTLFYFILGNMSTNLRKFRFPCYIWYLIIYLDITIRSLAIKPRCGNHELNNQRKFKTNSYSLQVHLYDKTRHSYLYVAYSWPDGWTDWAEIFCGLSWVGGVGGGGVKCIGKKTKSRGGRPASTTSRPNHILLIFSSKPPLNPRPLFIMCWTVSNSWR